MREGKVIIQNAGVDEVEVTADADNNMLLNGVTVGGKAPINTQTGTTYSLALTDPGKVVRMTNGAANTVTIDPEATTDIPLYSVGVVRMAGVGVTTIQGGTGVDVNGSTAGSVVISGQYKDIMWHKVGADEFEIMGALA